MVGLNIKKYLIDNGLKFSAVADKAKIPLQTFSAMINGKRRIVVEEYIDICRALDVDLDKFVTQAS